MPISHRRERWLTAHALLPVSNTLCWTCLKLYTNHDSVRCAKFGVGERVRFRGKGKLSDVITSVLLPDYVYNLHHLVNILNVLGDSIPIIQTPSLRFFGQQANKWYVRYSDFKDFIQSRLITGWT